MFAKIRYNYILAVLFGILSLAAYADAGTGNISETNYSALLCENDACSVTSSVNFGYFSTQSAYNVTVKSTELTGYIWGENFGWVVLNCVNTTSGCSSSNAEFKVANDYYGNLSGYAWGESTGWINFGPFSNNSAATVTIDGQGRFNGYAWAQNYGWIKFDCTSSGACVQTSWRSSSPVSSSSGSSGGTRFLSKIGLKKDTQDKIPVPEITPTLPEDLPEQPNAGILDDTKGIFQDFLNRPQSGDLRNTQESSSGPEDIVPESSLGQDMDPIVEDQYQQEVEGESDNTHPGFWSRVKSQLKRVLKNIFSREKLVESDIEILEIAE